MYHIYKTTQFESAHILKGHPKCGKLHGHSYKAEVWIDSEELNNEYGFVIDFHEISDYFKQFDHSDNILRISAEKISENAARFLNERMTHLHPNKTFSIKVRIWETSTGYAEFTI